MGASALPDWLDEACARLMNFRAMLERRRLFDVSTVGARIRTAREVKGYTQRQLGARLGLRRASVIQGWEKGERDVPARLFQKLAVALGVSPGWLLEGGDVPGGPAYGQRQAPKKLVRVGWCHTTRLSRRKRLAELELERVRALRMDRGPPLPSGALRAAASSASAEPASAEPAPEPSEPRPQAPRASPPVHERASAPREIEPGG